MRSYILISIVALGAITAGLSLAGTASADPGDNIVDCIVNYYAGSGCVDGGNCYESDGYLICQFGHLYYRFPLRP